MPDIFIPLENGKQLTFYNESVNKGILYQFAFEYTDQHRSEFNKYRNFKAFDAGFSVSQALFNEYVAYAAKNGIHPGQGELHPQCPILRLSWKHTLPGTSMIMRGFIRSICVRTRDLKERLKKLTGKQTARSQEHGHRASSIEHRAEPVMQSGYYWQLIHRVMQTGAISGKQMFRA
jgi:hypothetical protein